MVRPSLLFTIFLAISMLWLAQQTLIQETVAQEVVAQEQSEESIEEPNEKIFAIQNEISHLSSNKFTERQLATQKLIRCGIKAVPILEKYVNHSDTELRFRCEHIISQIKLNEYWRPVDEFAADADGKAGKTLAGWELVKATFGQDREAEARELLVMMHRYDREWMEFAASNPCDLDALKAETENAISIAPQCDEAALFSQAATLMFAFAKFQPDAQKPETQQCATNLNHFLLKFCLGDSDAAAGVRGKRFEVLLFLIGKWYISACPGHDTMVLADKLLLPQGVSVARHILKEPGYRSTTLHLAMKAIARAGDVKDVALLEPLWDRPPELYAYGSSIPQTRHMALCTAIQLHGKSPKSFGFFATSTDSCNISQADYPRALQLWREDLNHAPPEPTPPPPPQPDYEQSNPIWSNPYR